MTDIYLAVDTGGSQTKIIYQVKGTTELEYLVMSPEIEPISQAKLQEYQARQGWIGSPAPEQQAWIEWNGQVFVVGAFASQFDPEDRLRERKYENALYKVLTAIGIIVEKFKLFSKKKLTVQLAVLLPWDEYSDRTLFHEQLKAMLSGYRFQNKSIKVELERYLCRPEGGGLAATRIRQKGVDWLREKNLGVLMLGHRNVTALYFERGELKRGDSPLYGFSTMLDRVISLTSGLNRETLATAIFKGMPKVQVGIYGTYNKNDSSYNKEDRTKHPDWEKLETIKALASAKDASLRSKEVTNIVKAIKLATTEYWEKLERWLKKTLPEKLDEVIIAGGASRYFEPEIEKYFNCKLYFNYEGKIGGYTNRDGYKPKTDIVWGAGIQETIEEAMDFSQTETLEEFLPFRFVDVFGLFDCMIALEKEEEEKEILGKKVKEKKANDQGKTA